MDKYGLLLTCIGLFISWCVFSYTIGTFFANRDWKEEFGAIPVFDKDGAVVTWKEAGEASTAGTSKQSAKQER